MIPAFLVFICVIGVLSYELYRFQNLYGEAIKQKEMWEKIANEQGKQLEEMQKQEESYQQDLKKCGEEIDRLRRRLEIELYED